MVTEAKPFLPHHSPKEQIQILLSARAKLAGLTQHGGENLYRYWVNEYQARTKRDRQAIMDRKDDVIDRIRTVSLPRVNKRLMHLDGIGRASAKEKPATEVSPYSLSDEEVIGIGSLLIYGEAQDILRRFSVYNAPRTVPRVVHMMRTHGITLDSILERRAEIYPRVFGRLRDFSRHYPEYFLNNRNSDARYVLLPFAGVYPDQMAELTYELSSVLNFEV